MPASKMPQSVTIAVDDTRSVSGLLQAPKAARTCYVLAHGAGAGMAHPFMAAVANGLAERGIATLRYQFPYMERGSKRPDPPPVAHAAVRAAVAQAAALLPGLPLLAGGKSFGARMSSQAQAAAPLPGVRALVFVGFPLHPAGKPSDERAKHLFNVDVPMLFLSARATRSRIFHCSNLSLRSSARTRRSRHFPTPIIRSMRPRRAATPTPRTSRASRSSRTGGSNEMCCRKLEFSA